MALTVTNPIGKNITTSPQCNMEANEDQLRTVKDQNKEKTEGIKRLHTYPQVHRTI